MYAERTCPGVRLRDGRYLRLFPAIERIFLEAAGCRMLIKLGDGGFVGIK
jgi:hypothetical protein